MTKQQFKKMVNELIKTNNEAIRKKLDTVLKNNRDIQGMEFDYRLPKCFMCAVSKEMERQWRPLTKKTREYADRMARFV